MSTCGLLSWVFVTSAISCHYLRHGSCPWRRRHHHMDGADLQYPPSMIPELSRNGAKATTSSRPYVEATDDAGFLKRMTSKWYYRTECRIPGPISHQAGPTSASSIRVLKHSSSSANHRPFHPRPHRGHRLHTDFLFISAPPSVNGNRSFRTKDVSFCPGRDHGLFQDCGFPFYIGMLSGLLSLLLILHVIYCNIMGKAVPGWTTTMIVDCLFSGFQPIFIGVIGEYIGRIFEGGET